jgi:hypothetical protein
MKTEDALTVDVAPYLLQLDRLIVRGKQLHAQLATDPADAAALAESHIWQQDCAALIHQLSGGTKAHWLARAFSEAFLVRSLEHTAIEQAPMAEIVNRLVGVLSQAVDSLSSMSRSPQPERAIAAQPMRRFDFVSDAQLRPVLQRVYADSRDAHEAGDFGQSLVLSCSVLEALITDALARLERQGSEPLRDAVASWTFEQRIEAAERAGLISGGCARLPEAARRYRDLVDNEGQPAVGLRVSERDATLSRQVLSIVIRDLDPGR